MTQAGPLKRPSPPTLPQEPPPPPPPPSVTVKSGVAPLAVTPAMLTTQDVAALRSRAGELSNQLNSANGRRHELQRQLRTATGADKDGLEQRLAQLDGRISRLEGDIDENGKTLASLAAQKAITATTPGFSDYRGRRPMDDNVVPIAVVFTLFVLSPIALSLARMFWKRGSLPRQAPRNPESDERLVRMEQAIDSIAIEVERVSEGQRFVTRLLAEARPAGVLGQGAAERVPVSAAEKVGVPR